MKAQQLYRNRIAILCGLLFISFPARTFAGVVPGLTPVVVEDDEIGVAPVFAGSNSSLGAGGHVISDARYPLSDPDVTIDSNEIVVTAAPGEFPGLTIRRGDAVAGTGGTFYRHLRSYIDAPGTKAGVWAYLKIGGSTTTDAILAGPPGALTLQRWEGEDAGWIETGAVFTVIEDMRMNDAGQVAYLARANDSENTGIVFLDGFDVLATDDPGVGLPNDEEFVSFYDLTLNNDGELMFKALTTDGIGIFIRSPGGQVDAVVMEGNAAVGGGVHSDVPLPLSQADNGWLVIRDDLDGVPAASNRRIWVGTPGSLQLLAQEGGSVPVGGGNTAPLSNGLALAKTGVAADGTAVFQCTLDTGTPGVTFDNDDCVWFWNGSALELLLREGDFPVPSEPDLQITVIRDVAIGPNGVVAIATELQKPVGMGVEIRDVLWVTDPGGTNLRLAINKGDEIDLGGGDLRVISGVELNVQPTDGQPNGGDGRQVLINGRNEVLVHLRLQGSASYCSAVLELGAPPVVTTISGHVREDADGDGDFADVDDPFTDVVLKLYADDGMGTVTPTGPQIGNDAIPDMLGYFEFTGEIPSGNYVVVAEIGAASVQQGYDFTAPPEGRNLAVVVEGEDESGIDFLCAKPAPSETVVTLALMRPSSHWIDPGAEGESIDSPLGYAADLNSLESAPKLDPGGGLVADGVTPLGISIEVGSAPWEREIRWEVAVSGGAVAGGILSHMEVYEQEPFNWVPASQNGINSVHSFEPSVGSLAHLVIKPLTPWDLSFTGPVPELEVSLATFDPATEAPLAPPFVFKIRRPPVFLIPSTPSEGWGQAFLTELGKSRHPEFLVELPPLPPKEELNGEASVYVLDQLDWTEKISDLGNKWAVTRPDAIAHGYGGTWLRALCHRLELDPNPTFTHAFFRDSDNFGRGRFRAAVTIATPHLQLVPDLHWFGGILDAKLGALQTTSGLSTTQSHLPQTLMRIPGYSKLHEVGDFILNHIDRLSTETGYDPAARLHLMASRISGDSLLFQHLGIGLPSALGTLSPEGNDGFVGVEDALLGYAADGNDRTLLDTFHAFGEDTDFLGNAPRQTHFADPATEALRVLDSSADSYLTADSFLFRVLRSQSYRTDEAAKKNALTKLADSSIRPSLADLVLLLSGNQPRDTSETFVIELQEPAGEARTDGPYWFAEVVGVESATTEGITVTPDSGNPLRVQVEVADTVVGDVVLYASYQANGGTVFATPLLVTSQEPSGATATGIEVTPEEVTLAPGDEILPVVSVLYSNGDSARRWLTTGDIQAVSSHPGVIDVTDPLEWVAAGVGSATVTVTFDGMIDQMQIDVSDPFPAATYAQWRQQHFDAGQLADPAVSGDDADADGDGANTYVEYLTGGDPLRGGEELLPSIVNVDVSGVPLTALAVQVSTSISGEELVLQKSTDLTGWTILHDFTEEPDENDPLLISHLDFGPYHYFLFDVIPEQGANSVYYRLAVVEGSAPEPGPVTGTTELVFDFGGGFNTAYGIRVQNGTDGNFTYGGSPAYTPNVDLYYGANYVSWASGYGDLTNNLYSPSGIFEIHLVADKGYLIDLESFDLAAYNPRFTSDPAINLVEVRDGSGNPVFTGANAVISETARTTFDFGGTPLQGDEFTIYIDATNLGGDRDEIGLDNIRYSQRSNGVDYGDSSQLTFRIAGIGDSSPMDQSYGDRISAVRDGSFDFGGSGNFTPNVVVDYGPAVASPDHWANGFGSLRRVLFKDNDTSAELDITLTADAGYQVRLFSFDMAAFSTAFGSDPVVQSVKVLDGSGTELFTTSNPAISREDRTVFDLSTAPPQAATLVIRIDMGNLGSFSDEIAVDNIHFGQVAAP